MNILRWMLVLVVCCGGGMLANALIDGRRAQTALKSKPTDLTLRITPSINTTYLEYKSNGEVWVLWPDGRFIQVVPK